MNTVYFCFSKHSINQVVSQKQQMFCRFCFCYVHRKLEILNTIRKKKCRTNKLLTDRTKNMYTNLYFVTFICTRTIRIDIFQRLFVMPRKTFPFARTRVCKAPPETRTFLTNRIRPGSPACCACPTPPVPVPILKTRHALLVTT